MLRPTPTRTKTSATIFGKALNRPLVKASPIFTTTPSEIHRSIVYPTVGLPITVSCSTQRRSAIYFKFAA